MSFSYSHDSMLVLGVLAHSLGGHLLLQSCNCLCSRNARAVGKRNFSHSFPLRRKLSLVVILSVKNVVMRHLENTTPHQNPFNSGKRIALSVVQTPKKLRKTALETVNDGMKIESKRTMRCPENYTLRPKGKNATMRVPKGIFQPTRERQQERFASSIGVPQFAAQKGLSLILSGYLFVSDTPSIVFVAARYFP